MAYYSPNRMQMQSTVKGDDRYRRKSFPWLALLAVGGAVYGLIKLWF